METVTTSTPQYDYLVKFYDTQFRYRLGAYDPEQLNYLETHDDDSRLAHAEIMGNLATLYGVESRSKAEWEAHLADQPSSEA